MKKISVVTPCYNEESNVEELYLKVKQAFTLFSQYEYEHIFIDNASTDKTVQILKKLAEKDKQIKIIVNARNFGHIRSPFYGMLQAKGDAVIFIAADLQDPPELLTEFVTQWGKGAKVVIGIKPSSKENKLIFMLRKLYYYLSTKIAECNLIPNFTGFGLYDKKIMDILRTFEDPYPYFRGMIAEIGFDIVKIPYIQPRRKRGKTKNNFYTLYDMAMLGIITHSKVLMRLATFAGFGLSFLSLIGSITFFILKLVYWKEYSLGLAPILIGLFLFSSILLFFVGVLGEYVMQILIQTKKRPLVIERERINFEL